MRALKPRDRFAAVLCKDVDLNRDFECRFLRGILLQFQFEAELFMKWPGR